MKYTLLLLLLLTTTIGTMAQDKNKPAYQLFNKKGKQFNYGKMLKKLKETDVVLFGEQHNDPIAHWLQLEVAEDLYQAAPRRFAVGVEMLEADVQGVLNAFLAGKVSASQFEQEARVWPNYQTDYRPLLQFAKEMRIPVVATNVPRAYARVVSRESLAALDTISVEAKSYMAPLPIQVDMELTGYKKMLRMFGNSTHGSAKSEYIVQAQALKDATMAHFILQQVQQNKQLLHLNGAYHSDNFEGIGWYLQHNEPGVKVRTISTVQQPDVKKLSKDNCGKADFILVVPASMTRTY